MRTIPLHRHEAVVLALAREHDARLARFKINGATTTARHEQRLEHFVQCLQVRQDRGAPARFRAFRRVEHRSEEHTSELQSLMRISYAVFCLKKKKIHEKTYITKT